MAGRMRESNFAMFASHIAHAEKWDMLNGHVEAVPMPQLPRIGNRLIAERHRRLLMPHLRKASGNIEKN